MTDTGRGAPPGPGTPGLVSVIIPTYNRALLVGRAIESALAQTYEAIEVIVADDGSTDGTAAVAARYGSRVCFVRQANAGVSAARNLGLRYARGEFVAFLDSDDAWLPWKVAAQIALLQRYPQIGMVWTDMTAVDGEGRVRAARYLRTMYTAHHDVDIAQVCESATTLGALWPDASGELATHPVYVGEIYPYMLLGNLVHTSTVLLRRTWAQQVGGFDETRRTGEDYAYHFETTGLGPVALLDAPSILYAVGESDQLTASTYGIQIARHTLRTVLGALERGRERISPPLSRQRIATRLARLRAWLGEEELRAGNRANARRQLWASLRHRAWQPRVTALLVLACLPAAAWHHARALRHVLASRG